MKNIVIATNNTGKLNEFRLAFNDLPFNLLSLRDAHFPIDVGIEEPAMTFEGNAIIKAMVVGRKTGLLTLADDSGLEVDALGGRPGVFSARYAPGSDEDRYNQLLKDLENIPEEKRTAQFRCVIAIYDPQKEKVRTCEGVYRGKLLRIAKGTGGFGYDPIFYDATFGKTLSEITEEEKLSVSHRGKALVIARQLLEREF